MYQKNIIPAIDISLSSSQFRARIRSAPNVNQQKHCASAKNTRYTPHKRASSHLQQAISPQKIFFPT